MSIYLKPLLTISRPPCWVGAEQAWQDEPEPRRHLFTRNFFRLLGQEALKACSLKNIATILRMVTFADFKKSKSLIVIYMMPVF